MSSDYFMRQVEGMADAVAQFLFGETEPVEEQIWETQLSGERHALLIDLRLLLTLGEVNGAETLLFRRMEEDPAHSYREVAEHFYRWLDGLEDDRLAECGFSREEIAQGREAVARFYGDRP